MTHMKSPLAALFFVCVLASQPILAESGITVKPPPSWKTLEYRKATEAETKELQSVAEAMNTALKKKDQDGLKVLIDTDAMVEYLVRMRIMTDLTQQKRDHLKFALSTGFLQMFAQFAAFYTCDSMRIVKAQVDKEGTFAELTVRKKSDGVFSLESWWLKKSDGKWRLYDFSSEECQVQVLVLFGSLMSGQYSKQVQEWTKHMPKFLGAMQLLQEQRLEECRKALEELEKAKMPEFVESIRLLLLSILHYADEDNDKALAYAEKALKVKADLFAAYELIAEIQLDREKPDLVLKTAEAYFKVLGKEPGMALAAVKAYRMKKEDAKAEALCLEALKIEPSAHDLLLELASLLPETRFDELKPYLKPLLTPSQNEEAEEVEDLFENDDRYQEVLEAFMEAENLVGLRYLKSMAKELELDTDDLEDLEMAIYCLAFFRKGGLEKIIKDAGGDYVALANKLNALVEDPKWKPIVAGEVEALAKLMARISAEPDDKAFLSRLDLVFTISAAADGVWYDAPLNVIEKSIVPQLSGVYKRIAKNLPTDEKRLIMLNKLLNWDAPGAFDEMVAALKEEALQKSDQWEEILEAAQWIDQDRWLELLNHLASDPIRRIYLDLATFSFQDEEIETHPFATAEGHAILKRFLTMDDPYVQVALEALETFDRKSVASFLPMLSQVKSPQLRLFAAYLGLNNGAEQFLKPLQDGCLDYRYSAAARDYLDILERKRDVPQKALEPEFLAKAEASSRVGLDGRVSFEHMDTRTLYWPSEKKKLVLSLYRYERKLEDGKTEKGIVLGGNGGALITEKPTDGLTAEDAYALYCSHNVALDKFLADDELFGENEPLIYSVEDGHKLLKAKNPTWPK